MNNETRFEFGKNWHKFQSVLDDDRILEAENSLKIYLGVDSLKGLTFLDVGSGSGLFSLAARRLGAQVLSFDYDPNSVECTNILKNKYYANDESWVIETGSVLDDEYLANLGTYDVVYSWGVLHHTGTMWEALENVALKVRPGGVLFVALYNHQQHWTTFITKVKYHYNKSPAIGKWVILPIFVAIKIIKGTIKDLLLLRNPLKRYSDKRRSRGMSVWHDWIDWIGGYPFEAAKPETIIDFFIKKGFIVKKLTTAGGGHGCNEFVFDLSDSSIAS